MIHINYLQTTQMLADSQKEQQDLLQPSSSTIQNNSHHYLYDIKEIKFISTINTHTHTWLTKVATAVWSSLPRTVLKSLSMAVFKAKLRNLRSSGIPVLAQPSRRTNITSRSFCNLAPPVWNSLLKMIVFKCRLKLTYFDMAYNSRQ